jgi:hypothetical protein
MMIKLLAFSVDRRRKLYGRLRDAPLLLGNADFLKIQACHKLRQKILEYIGAFPSSGLQQIPLSFPHTPRLLCV